MWLAQLVLPLTVIGWWALVLVRRSEENDLTVDDEAALTHLWWSSSSTDFRRLLGKNKKKKKHFYEEKIKDSWFVLQFSAEQAPTARVINKRRSLDDETWYTLLSKWTTGKNKQEQREKRQRSGAETQKTNVTYKERKTKPEEWLTCFLPADSANHVRSPSAGPTETQWTLARWHDETSGSSVICLRSNTILTTVECISDYC